MELTTKGMELPVSIEEKNGMKELSLPAKNKDWRRHPPLIRKLMGYGLAYP